MLDLVRLSKSQQKKKRKEESKSIGKLFKSLCETVKWIWREREIKNNKKTLKFDLRYVRIYSP